MSEKEYSDAIVYAFCDFFARHGWMLVVVLVVLYNLHNPVRRRLAKWTNDKSIADANRPERRSVLDRERMTAVAWKQEEAQAAGREAAVAEGKTQKSPPGPTFKKDA